MEQLGKRGDYHDDMLLQNSEEERRSNAHQCLQPFNCCNTRIERCPTNLGVHSLSVTGKPLSWHRGGREGVHHYGLGVTGKGRGCRKSENCQLSVNVNTDEK